MSFMSMSVDFPFQGKYITKFKVKGMVEPIDLVTLDNGNILVTDGAKACVHVLEDTGKYRGLFGNLTNLKCPAGMATYVQYMPN